MTTLTTYQQSTIDFLYSMMMEHNASSDRAGLNQEYGESYFAVHAYMTRIFGVNTRDIEFNWGGNGQPWQDVNESLNEIEERRVHLEATLSQCETTDELVDWMKQLDWLPVMSADELCADLATPPYIVRLLENYFIPKWDELSCVA